ncbi:MAG: DNA repair protein RadC [Gammaproteobacteria bacterium]|jgi:DNA repair protein RadC
MKIAEWPVTERPREKLLTKGASSLSDAELLAILLRTGAPGLSAVDLGRELLTRFTSIRNLLDASQTDLCNIHGLGTTKYANLKAALELSSRYLEENLKRESPLSSPDSTRIFLKSRLRSYQHEVFACIFMDNRHRLIAFEEMFSGTIDGASVYPREVVKRCLQLNAAAVIFAHNHPSGVAEPSHADIQITRRLTDSLALVDIRVLDHFIIGDSTIISFAERGLI